MAIKGTKGNDILNGTASGDSISGGKGNDKIQGGGGDDVIDERVYSENFTAAGWKYDGTGGQPATFWTGYSGTDPGIYFNASNQASGDVAAQTVNTTIGAKYTVSYSLAEYGRLGSSHTMLVEAIDDTGRVIASGTSVVTDGQTKHFTLEYEATSPTTALRFTNTEVSSTHGSDLRLFEVSHHSSGLDAYPDDDVIDGGRGADKIYSGSGADVVHGGEGDDLIDGGSGDDTLYGGAGNDKIYAGPGQDTVKAGEGNDLIDARDTPSDNWTLGGPGRIGAAVWSGYEKDAPGIFFNTNEEAAGDWAEQKFETTVGDTYTMDFKLAEYGPKSSSHTMRIEIVDIDGNVIQDQTIVVQNGETQAHSLTYTATTPHTIVRIRNTDVNDSRGSDIRLFDFTHKNDAGDDIDGGEGQDTIYAGGGNDKIDGGGGDDQIHGGRGHDLFVWDGASNDVIHDFLIYELGDKLNDGDHTNNDHVDLSKWYNSDTANAALDMGGNFESALDMLRQDAADGRIDGIINGVNCQMQLGLSGELTLKNGQGDLIQGASLTFDTTNVAAKRLRCFVRGTKIMTLDGMLPIESLRVGDYVLTLDNSYKEIIWVGHRKVGADVLESNPNFRPIRIKKGALGAGVPDADLLLSPQHRVLVRSNIAARVMGKKEILVAAKDLVGLWGIEIASDVKDLEYWHLIFDQHEIVYSNGAMTESLFVTEESWDALPEDVRAELLGLFGDFGVRDLMSVPARRIARGQIARSILERHAKNNKALT